MTERHSSVDGLADSTVSGAQTCIVGNAVTFLPQHTGDAKKRPLSVSSTSSATSSTSSLPRHQRKKVAGMGGSPNPLACSGLVGGALGLDLGATAMDTSTPRSSVAIMECGTVLENLAECESPHESSFTDKEADLSVEDSPRVSFAMPDFSGLTYLQKVVKELLDTEEQYVEDLEQIVKGYRHELKSCERLTEDNHATLFGNVEEIWAFNRVLLGDLMFCKLDPICLAQCFVDKQDEFVIYTHYCTNFPSAMEVLSMTSRNSELSEDMVRCQQKLGHCLPLGSYLLKPVQRILKYHLFLQNMLNNFDQSSPCLEVLSAALNSMTGVAQHINEMKRHHERAVHAQELQTLLYESHGADYTTFGSLVLEDTFRMHGAKASRQLYLFSKGLLIVKRREDGSLVIKASIMVSNLMLIESLPKEPLSFQVVPFDNPRMGVIIQAKSLDQKRHWCQELKRLILENFKVAIPEKAKEIVLTQLGKSREEEDFDEKQSENVDPSKKASCAPGYLEKRRTRRKSTSLMPDFPLLIGQRIRKSGRKSDLGGSPKNSPKIRRRRSDVCTQKDKIIETKAQPKVSQSPQYMIEKRKSRSRSLENLDSITEEEQKETIEETEELDLSLSKPDLAVTSYDDACPRAQRMSRLLQDEGLGAQLTDRFSGVGWHKDVVSSVLNISSVKRAESYRVATELNRVSSMTAQSCARTGSSTPKISSCGHTDTGNSRVDPLRPAANKNFSTSHNQKCSSRSDDDYVKIIYEDNGYSLQEERRNSANNVIYSQNPALRGLDTCNDYVELFEDTPDGGDSNNNTGGQQHRPYRQLSHPESRTRSVQALPKSASSSDMGQYLARRGFFAKKGRMFSEPGIIPLDPETCLLNGVSVSSVCSKGPQRRQSNQSNSSMANCPSSSHMKNDHDDDPWVLREDVQTSRSHNCTNIKRSNSCSSVHASTESLAKEQTIKGHRKQPSDTLIFINRNAFRSSPTAISRDRELERLVARYCTPPRDMGPEDLVQEITECKDRGKVALKYATPPRSFFTSVDEGSTDDTVIVNVNSCVDASEVSNKLASCMTSSNSSPSCMCHSVNTNSKITSETVPSHMKSSVTDTMLSSQSSSSFHSDHQLNSPGSITKSPSALSSPSSIVSNESIVDSLRNAVFSITSKFRSSRSVESSPSRSPLVTSPDDTDVEKSPSKGKKSKKKKVPTATLR